MDQKIKMLFTGDKYPAWTDKFREYFDIEIQGYGLQDEAILSSLSQEELKKYLEDKEFFLIGFDRVTKETIENAPDLKVIMSIRDGPEENVDVAACTEAGIPVISSAGRCAVSVSELTFALMLCLCKPIIPTVNQIRKEGWTVDNKTALRRINLGQTELYEKTLGIAGFGRNAQMLAPMAKAFRMNVIAYDPYVSEEKMESMGVKKVSLEECCSQADYLVPLARVNKDTEGMISRELINSMKPTACLVNTGRAKLVDYDALFDALIENRIKGAALDVHSPEPLGPLGTNRIYEVPEDKLIITGHIAGFTQERATHQYELLWAQLHSFFNGEIPVGCINKQVFDTPQFKERGAKYFGYLKK